MKMDRKRLWFLDSAVKEGVALNLMGDEKRFEEWVNFPFHGLELEEVRAILNELVEERLIAVRQSDEDMEDWGELDRRLELEDFGEERGKMLSYYLTARGGEMWESYAQPDWDVYRDFLEYRRFLNDTEEGALSDDPTAVMPPGFRDGLTLIATTQERINEMVECLRYRVVVAPETVVWTELLEWRPNYWKTLPRAFQFDCDVERLVGIEDEAFLEHKVREDEVRNREWYRRFDAVFLGE